MWSKFWTGTLNTPCTLAHISSSSGAGAAFTENNSLLSAPRAWWMIVTVVLDSRTHKISMHSKIAQTYSDFQQQDWIGTNFDSSDWNTWNLHKAMSQKVFKWKNVAWSRENLIRTRIALVRVVLALETAPLFFSVSANLFSSCVKYGDWAICDFSKPSTVACTRVVNFDAYACCSLSYLWKRNKCVGFYGPAQKHVRF